MSQFYLTHCPINAMQYMSSYGSYFLSNQYQVSHLSHFSYVTLSEQSTPTMLSVFIYYANAVVQPDNKTDKIIDLAEEKRLTNVQ